MRRRTIGLNEPAAAKRECGRGSLVLRMPFAAKSATGTAMLSVSGNPCCAARAASCARRVWSQSEIEALKSSEGMMLSPLGHGATPAHEHDALPAHEDIVREGHVALRLWVPTPRSEAFSP
jgi:hypothetical protein